MARTKVCVQATLVESALNDEESEDKDCFFVEKTIYHEHAKELRLTLEKWIKNGNDHDARNKFFCGKGNQESWWPHTSKPEIWMKAIMPKACTVDLVCKNFIAREYHNKQHAVVSSNFASRALCGPMKYAIHHSDPKFVKEYNEYVLGMMYKYKILVEGLIGPEGSQTREHINKNQIVFVQNHLQFLASAVYDFDKQPIGKYNDHYLASTDVGMKTEEDFAFVLGMANCEKFEIWIEHKTTSFDDDDDSTILGTNENVMLLWTRFVFPQSDGGSCRSEHNKHMFGLFKGNNYEYPSSEVPRKWPFLFEKTSGNKKRKMKWIECGSGEN